MKHEFVPDLPFRTNALPFFALIRFYDIRAYAKMYTEQERPPEVVVQ